MIEMAVHQEDVLDVLRVEADVTDVVQDVIHVRLLRAVDEDQPFCGGNHPRGHRPDTDVIQVVEDLERRNLLILDITTTTAAERGAECFGGRCLRGRLAQVFRDLEAAPFQSHLRLHPLHGDLQGLHAVSVTHSYRITLTLRITASEIVLLDIGTHDEVYQ